MPKAGRLRPGTASVRAVVLANYAGEADAVTVANVRLEAGGPRTSVAADGTLTASLDVRANDADAAEIIGVVGAKHGTATTDGRRVNYVSEPGFVGTERLTYFVRTAAGGTARTTATLTAVGDDIDDALAADLAANDPDGNLAPSARDDAQGYVALAGQTLTADGLALPGVLANDRDREPVDGGFVDDPLAARLVTGPEHGSLTLNADGTFAYTPDMGFEGVDRFVYEATDGLATDTAAVTIEVFADAAALTLDKLAAVQRAHLDYAATYGHVWLNPGFISQQADRWADGRPKLSWRVYLLPFLGRGDLFERFDLDAAWDSPQNLPLLDEMPDAFRLPGEAAGSTGTRVQGLRGNDAVLGRRPRTVAGVEVEEAASLDNLERIAGSQNVLMTAVASEAVPWTAPEDLAFDPADPHAGLDTSAGEILAARPDGLAVRLPADLHAATLGSLITVETRPDVHDGGVDAPDWVETAREAETLVDGDAVLRAAGTLDESGDRDLRQIGLAMFNYADAFGQFPVAGSPYFGEDGRPLLSWRVHALPYLGHAALYDQFDLEAPWDDPHNLALLPFMPDVFRSPGDAADTPMQVFTGPDAPFEFRDSGDQTGPTYRDFRDGASHTILAAEVGVDRAVPWTAPQDAAFDLADPLAALGRVDGDVRFVAADGQTGRLHADVAAEDFAAAVTRNGGEAFDLATLLRRQHQARGESFEDAGDVTDRLKGLSIAMLNSEDTFGTFPLNELDWRKFDPETNRPYLSWRVHVLPYLGHADLYERFDPEQPWDAPQNLAAAADMPDVFRSLGDDAGSTTTRFQTFFGEGAPWGDRLTTLFDGRQGYVGPTSARSLTAPPTR